MTPLDRVLAELLETWNQRYEFILNREKQELTLRVPNFELIVTKGEGEEVWIRFEEAGQKHRVECPLDEAPRVIEGLLFPSSLPD